jgi:DNA-binding transcriptional regulator YiaG
MSSVEWWLPVDGYEGLYEVSSLGRVRRVEAFQPSYSGRERKTSLSNCGYKRVVFLKGGVRRTFSVHRLVAVAFIPNPDGKKTVNHKNGVKTDNRAENLEWATTKENIKHAFDTGLKENCRKRGEENPRSRLTLVQVAEIRSSSLSLAELARRFGVSTSTVHLVRRYKTWKRTDVCDHTAR